MARASAASRASSVYVLRGLVDWTVCHPVVGLEAAGVFGADDAAFEVLDDGINRGSELRRARGRDAVRAGETGLLAAFSSASRSRGLRRYSTSSLALPDLSLGVSVPERPAGS